MKKSHLMLFFICCAMIAAVGCSKPEPAVEADTEAAVDTGAADAVMEAPVAEARHDVVYACNCGADCDCNSISTAPGTCSCGKELAGAHVVKVVDTDVALLCTCGADCDCEIDAADETKCSCGSDLKRVSLAGSGLYFCNCGGSCTCNFISAEPGTCSCGMELVTS
jgi:hypothetical protein